MYGRSWQTNDVQTLRVKLKGLRAKVTLKNDGSINVLPSKYNWEENEAKQIRNILLEIGCQIPDFSCYEYRNLWIFN